MSKAKTKPRRPKARPPAAAHPLFRRPVPVPADRQGHLLAVIEEAVLELFPLAAAVRVCPEYPTLLNEWEQVGETVRVWRPARFTRPGTVGATAAALARQAEREAATDERRLALSSVFAALADRAGDIPVGEFAPADWAAFVALLPDRFRDPKERASRTLAEAADRLRATGLAIPKAEVPTLKGDRHG